MESYAASLLQGCKMYSILVVVIYQNYPFLTLILDMGNANTLFTSLMFPTILNSTHFDKKVTEYNNV